MSDKKINIPKNIELEKVTLKYITPQRAEERVKILLENVEHLSDFLPFLTADYCMEDEIGHIKDCEKRWAAGKAYNYEVIENSTGEYIGSYNLFATSLRRKCYEFGYWIAENKQGHGYVTQAVDFLTNLALKELEAERVIIRCNQTNLKSAGVAVRNGYFFEGKEFCADRGEDVYCFIKLRDQEKSKELEQIQDELKRLYKIEDL